MKRRDVLKYTALLTGGAIAAPVMTSILSGCKVEVPEQFVPKVFDANQFNFIKTLSGTILPEGEIPGAVSVGVPEMIDHMVNVTYSPKKQKEYLQGLDALIELWSKDPNQAFLNINPESQLTFLRKHELSSKQRAEERAAAGGTQEKKYTETEDMNASGDQEEKPLTAEEKSILSDEVYAQIKQQTVAYYLSTETVGTQLLNYLPVPGQYQSCISMAETNGKAWTI